MRPAEHRAALKRNRAGVLYCSVACRAQGSRRRPERIQLTAEQAPPRVRALASMTMAELVAFCNQRIQGPLPYQLLVDLAP